MAHHHHHHHHHAGRGDSARNLAIAFLLNAAFTGIEIGGGFWTNSVAILADALHDAGDCLSLGLAWFLQRLSQRKGDSQFTYGYHRYSVVGALVTGLVLAVGLTWIGWQSLVRLWDPQPVYAAGMWGLALLGIAVNGFAAWRLSGGGSLNEKVASWHLWEDTAGWGAVLVGSSIMWIWDLPILDPMLSLGISAFILWNLRGNLSQVLRVFLQRAPEGLDRHTLEDRIRRLPGVVDSHHTHIWTLDGERHVFSTHLVMAAESTRVEIQETKQAVWELLRDEAVEHVTVEIELVGESCVYQPVNSCDATAPRAADAGAGGEKHAHNAEIGREENGAL